MEHGKEYISSGGTRNSMELVKFCVQSGATGRQSVDESPTDGFPAERTVGNIAPRDQRCVSLRGPCALDAFDRSSRIYLYSIEQPHLVPLAVSHSPCGRPRGKIWNSPRLSEPALYQFFVLREEKSLSKPVNRLSYPGKWEVAIRSETSQ